MYHRIAEPDSDPWGLCVSPEKFEQHLELLTSTFQVQPLERLARDVARGRVERRSVGITIDDGYADSLHEGVPLLARSGAPATIFVTTGAVDDRREFWWDELDRLLLQPGCLPETLQLRIGGMDLEWRLEPLARYDPEEARKHRGWKAWDPPPTSRHAIYLELWKALYAIPSTEKQDAIDSIRAWTGVRSEGRPSHRILTSNNIIELGNHFAIEIGAHTVTHPALPTLSARDQEAEIVGSRFHLEALLGVPVTAFAYPHGAYDASTVELVRRNGFRCACTTDTQPLSRATSVLTLPRIQVLDWDGAELEQRLKPWLGAGSPRRQRTKRLL